jgi:ketosteroid isomerase-like protein
MLASQATRATSLVRRGYAAFARGDVGAVLAMMADDARWAIQPTMPMIGGTFTGREQIAGFFQTLSTTWAELRVEPERFAQNGELVTVLGTHHGRTHGGTSFDIPFAHVWTLRGDLVTSFTEHTDSARATQLLQESGQAPAQALSGQSSGQLPGQAAPEHDTTPSATRGQPM